ncbi:MAG: VWA domain-containing protein [Bacteroidia bacterium]|nr:VWA domain-containing protein [Bacteroidia bacterium]MCZ2249190.1 VWA domain-containing protein [Bacteroidia bacterium]
MFRFENIWALYGLVLIPVFIILFLFILRWRNKNLLKIAELPLQHIVLPQLSKTKIVWRFVFWLTALSLIVIAIANPQFGTRLEDVKQEGIDIMIALDVSNSMKAQDLQPNRLESAKQAIGRLINNMVNDRIGIVIFAGQSYVQLPITSDYGSAKLFLRNISTDLVQTQGTAIGSAIDLAAQSFDQNSKTNKVIIVITDGENHEDDAVKAAEKAAEQGVRVFTIGMGSESGVPLPIINNGNVVGYYKDNDGNTVVSKLNTTLLKEIAAAGNGVYVQAGKNSSALNVAMNELNKIEKKEYGSRKYTDFEGRFQFFIAGAILLLLAETSLSERKSKLLQRLNLFNENKK